jgi:hypothetical protein
MFKRLLFWRKKRQPSWINEFYHGSFRALVGIAYNEVGGIHHVVKIQKRNEKSVYKDVDVFRNYEWPAILVLFRNIEDHAQSLTLAG